MASQTELSIANSYALVEKKLTQSYDQASFSAP